MSGRWQSDACMAQAGDLLTVDKKGTGGRTPEQRRSNDGGNWPSLLIGERLYYRVKEYEFSR